MGKEYFLNKISCEFAVITHDADCHIITNELGIEPTRFFNKGDRFTSKHSSRVGYKPFGLWAIQSESIIGEEIDVSRHIKFFEELLGNKMDKIDRLKNHFQFECVFSIDIETEDAGVGIDLNETELKFIANLSSRYSCRFISRETV